MYEFLKNLFEKNEDGTTKPMTADELEAAIKGANGLNVVNLSDGGYISKEKYDAAVKNKDDEIAGMKQSIDDANAKIKSFEDMDVEGIKKSVKDWEEKYKADTKALNDQIAANKKAYAEELFLSGYNFTSKAAKSGVLAELREKDFKLDDDGTLLGAKEYIDKLMEDEDYKGAFVVPDSGDGSGDDGAPDAGNDKAGASKPHFTGSSSSGSGNGGQGGKKMTIVEAMKYKNEHPDADISSLLG